MTLFTRYFRSLSVIGIAGASIVAAMQPGFSQDNKMWRPPAPPEATFYRDANFSGPAVFVGEAKPDLGLAWPVNSIRVKSGAWELCDRTNFRGSCRIVERDTPILNRGTQGMVLQSIRPIGTGTGTGLPGNNPSLKGSAAQFYPEPARYGYRTLACSNGTPRAGCIAATAREFCVAMGWRAAARHATQIVSGRVYLADVLCNDTGR